ncbi:hypothetical protein G3I77_05110 [Streptomyces sp. D2-8]|uniref:acyltransferase domain-containing protein n=1 Tax=Streptomyces sp. D2-8 TaxID=2707767 RepID=UPI0020BD62E4|nr:acyltransferase domain-containing protein [Streptomyces sp. D2-8]MCK8432436.1 hypothetical protein [Streptomyces sp. D2-8]
MLPDADTLPEILLDLAVPHEDIDDLVALRRTLTGDAGAMRLLEECVEQLVRDIGEVGAEVPLAERLAEAGRNMAFRRRRQGTGGVQVPQWLTHHFRGELYQLGRLQFFGDPDLPPAGLPRCTSVERAVGDHLRAGGHWYVEHGWFRR